MKLDLFVAVVDIGAQRISFGDQLFDVYYWRDEVKIKM